MKPAPLSQDAIVSALKGQTLRVPDFTKFFSHWPASKLHMHHGALVPIVDASIDRVAAAHPALARRKRDDIAGLAGRWYHQATDERIETLALFTVWLVCWDDAVDAGEGELADDLESSERWRARTLQIIRGALGIEGAAPELRNIDVVNALFQAFGDHFTEGFAMDQRRRFYNELKCFIDSCAIEQKLRLNHFIPDYESYMAFRLGTVGGSVLCSLVEYVTQEPLPSAVIEAPAAKRMWMQVSVLLAILNDVLSLKKELRTDCAINAVTALMEPGKGLDDVVGELSENMKQAIRDFDGAAGELLEQVKEDEALASVVRRLQSPRYQIAKLIREDGTLEIVL
ncbi:isoprenoid synthase domain-containing protein [Mariannaea sp. PMI_226]|nr:isoprenoid synthase domain-containing protein [Mariannaea sp. PMI_226]